MKSVRYPTPIGRWLLAAALLTASSCTPQQIAAPSTTPADPIQKTEQPAGAPLASAIDPFAGTSSSSVHEDPVGGYRLTYPSDWEVTGSPGSETAIEFPAVIGDPLGLRAGLYLVGFKLVDAGVFTLDELFASFGTSLSAEVLVDPPESIELDGVEGYQASFLDLSIQGQGRLLTFIQDEQGYVIILLVQPAVHFATFQPVFESMLDSLEFMPAAQQP